MLKLKRQSPRRKQDALVLAQDRLRQALAGNVPGQERQWVARVGEALTHVEKALQEHRASAEVPDGLFAEVDDTRPTLARQVDQLCSGQDDLLKQVQGLQAEVSSVSQGLPLSADPSGPKNAARESAWAGFRQQTEQFLAGLQHQEEAETTLILESVNTDIGVGD